MTTGSGPPINSFGAIPSLALQNAKVFEGIAFSIRQRIAVVKSTSVDLIFDPTAFAGSNVVVLPFSFEAIAGPILVDIYSGATANDDGTLIPIYNRDFVSGSAPTTIARLSPTGVNVGPNPPLEYLIPSDGVGAGTTGGTGGDSLVANIDFSKKLLMRLTNSDAVTDAIVGVKFDFFEVPAPT